MTDEKLAKIEKLAQAIVVARSAVPELCTEMRRLKAQVNALEQDIKELARGLRDAEQERDRREWQQMADELRHGG